MIKIEIDAATKRQINSLVTAAEGFEAKMKDRSEVLKKIKRRQITRWARNFSSEGAIYGEWPALSPIWTIPERVVLGYGIGPKLVREGSLMSWVLAENEKPKETNQTLQWNFSWSGSRDGSLAVLHHQGYRNAAARSGRVPARKIWDLDNDDRKAMETIVEEYVDRIATRYFGVE